MQTTSERAAASGADGKSHQQAEPIAIIGMAGRFPGSPDIDTFWDQLCAGTDAISEIPRDRYDVEAIFEPSPSSPGRTSSRWGGFLEKIREFDAQFFGISPREATHMDPQQRLLLETTYEALEDAGQDLGRVAGSATAVYMGQLGGDYWHMQYQNPENLEFYGLIGAAARAMTAGRVAYAFDFRGPSITLDTACSSSLTAVHMAAQAIRSGESTMAVAGAANVVLLPEEGTVYSGAQMLAKDGRCKFGDASADGFVRSDGAGVVVLKALSQARADGDHIRAVVLGSAIGNDGQSSGYLVTPGIDGQRDVLLRAYEQAGISPGAIDYLEAHGTGTSVGDKVELQVFGQVLGSGRPASRPCLVGSVKTNIGHAEAAAGMAGLIKTVLCLEHREVPANLHQHRPNPDIPWDELPIRLPKERTPLPDRGRPHTAGVSSFGLTGANAHVVLSAPDPADLLASGDANDTEPQLLAVSAADPDALAVLASAWADLLEDDGPHAPSLRDLAYSASLRRTQFDCRLALPVSSRSEAAATLRDFAAQGEAPDLASAAYIDEERPRVAFVFPGQGSQWIGMGRQLLDTEPVFLEAMTACDEVISSENGWSVIELLRSGDAERFSRVDVIQPALWAMEIALAELWRSWGVRPDVVIGHSMGEAAAAYISGALSLADSGAVICRRSRMARRMSGQGTMAWVELSAQQAAEAIAGCEASVSIAAANSPTSTLLSGDRDTLEQILGRLDEQDVFNRWINVDYASHGPQMDAIRDDLLRELKHLTPRAGEIPLRSTLLNETIDGSQLDARYWARNIREPVNLVDAVRAQLELGDTVFIEISPHPVLATAITATSEDHGQPSLATGSLRREEDERTSLLSSLAKLYAANVPFDWAAVIGGGTFTRLPRYPWQRTEYWLEEPASRPSAAGEATAAVLEPAAGAPGVSAPGIATPAPTSHSHPLLGEAVPAPAGTWVWEGPIDRNRNAYLDDHQVQGSVIVPGTAYVELAAAAAGQIHGDVPLSVRDVRYREALFLDAGVTAVRVTLTQDGDRLEYGLQVHSRSTGTADWDLHAEAKVAPVSGAPGPAHDLPAIQARCPQRQSGEEFYVWHAARGNQWVGAFQAIEEVWRGDGEALARLSSPLLEADPGTHRFHPAVLDAAAHALVAARPDIEPGEDHAFVLGGIDDARLYRRPSTRLWSHCRLKTEPRADSFTGDVRILDDSGALVAELLGLRLQYLMGRPPAPLSTPASTDEGDAHHDWLYDLRWPETPLHGAFPEQAGGTWVVLTDSGPTGRSVTKALQQAGQRVVAVTAARGYATTGADRHRVDPASRDDLVKILMETAQDATIRGVVHMWSLDATSSHDANATEIERAEHLTCRSVVHLAQALHEADHPQPPRLWLVTRGAQRARSQDAVRSPFQTPLWGLGRTLAIEHPSWQTSLVDLDDAPSTVEAFVSHLLHGDEESQVALRDGQRLAARLARKSLDVPRSTPAVPPQAGEVLLKVTHAGIGAAGASQINVWGCAGVILATGDDAGGFTAGDSVIALARGPLTDTLTVASSLVARKPASWSAAEAATLPVGYVTAYRALHQLARVCGTDRVALDDETGTLSGAVEQISRWLGASLLRATSPGDQRDIDAVVTTGSGRHGAVHPTALGAGGRYLDCSPTFGAPTGCIAAGDISRNRAYHAVDLGDLISRRPQEVGAALSQVCQLAERRVLEPVAFTEIPAGDIRPTDPTSGIVVLVQADEQPLPVTGAPSPGDFTLQPEATYLVTGGLGGIGTRVVQWLADRGARHLLLTGRSPLPPIETWNDLTAADPASDQVGLLRSLMQRGIEVEYAAVDVTDLASMRTVLSARERARLPRVRGVLHVAGTIDYATVQDTTSAQISSGLHAKVSGAWALHQLMQGEALDFFVLFSSGSALLGSPLLATYAAGNAFLDGLAHYRLQQRQPATVVNWGFWDSVGMMARKAQQDDRDVVPRGMEQFSPSEGLDVLETLLCHGCDQAAVLRVDWPEWANAYPALAATPQFRDLTRAAAVRVPADRPVRDVRPAPPPAAQALPEAPKPAAEAAVPAPVVQASPRPAADDGLLDELTVIVAQVLGLPASRINATTPLKRMGLDSLMAVELRSRIERTHHTTIPVTLLLKGGTLNKLADHIRTTSAETPTAATATPSSKPTPPTTPAALTPVEPARTPSSNVITTDESPTPPGDLLTDLTTTVAQVLGLPASRINATTPLKRMGLDSLMAVELRSRIERTHHTTIPVTLLLKGGTLNKLADHIRSQDRAAATEGAEL